MLVKLVIVLYGDFKEKKNKNLINVKKNHYFQEKMLHHVQILLKNMVQKHPHFGKGGYLQMKNILDYQKGQIQKMT